MSRDDILTHLKIGGGDILRNYGKTEQLELLTDHKQECGQRRTHMGKSSAGKAVPDLHLPAAEIQELQLLPWPRRHGCYQIRGA